MTELGQALLAFDADPEIGCIILTGSEKAFAAGADISVMVGYNYMDVFKGEFITRNWETIRRVRKLMIAADNAKFGQPEVKLGIVPGAGGTQRLPRAVSKAKAMDLCLTGRMMDAQEAERAGLVSRVVAADKLMDEALAAAITIADMSQPVVAMIKDSVNRAYESTLSEGIKYERAMFYSCFATEDQTEGMKAFMEKRPPNFKNQ